VEAVESGYSNPDAAHATRKFHGGKDILQKIPSICGNADGLGESQPILTPPSAMEALS
jgi:hypothetical protein